MDSGSFFVTLLVIWYFRKYHSSHPTFLSFVNSVKRINDYINHYNSLLVQSFLINNTPLADDTSVDITAVSASSPVVTVKYEDKYLQDVKQMNKEFTFDNLSSTTAECLKINLASHVKRREEIAKLIVQIQLKLDVYEGVADDCIVYDSNGDLGQTRDEKIKTFLAEKELLVSEDQLLSTYLDTHDGQQQCMKQAEEDAKQILVNKKLDSLANCCVFEHTPLGNVVMLYDNVRETFKYYSDNTIPYRYLEVVSRKYVKQFHCRPIFVDMEEEIHVAEAKRDSEKQAKEAKEELDRKRKEDKSKSSQVEEKKSVFAKFKSYNKDSSGGHVNTGAPPKNSLPNTPKTDKQATEYVLKNNANRYTYEGKLANFSFIKKVDRKVVDKKLAMSFADFKKMRL